MELVTGVWLSVGIIACMFFVTLTYNAARGIYTPEWPDNRYPLPTSLSDLQALDQQIKARIAELIEQPDV